MLHNGKLYLVKHKRKGDFVMRVTDIESTRTWGVVVKVKAKALIPHCEPLIGEEILVVNSNCSFTEQKESQTNCDKQKKPRTDCDKLLRNLKRKLAIATKTLQVYANMDLWNARQNIHYISFEPNPIKDGWEYAAEALNKMKNTRKHSVKEDTKNENKIL